MTRENTPERKLTIRKGTTRGSSGHLSVRTWFCASLVAALLLAACGEGDVAAPDIDDETDSTVDEPTVDEPTVDEETHELRFATAIAPGAGLSVGWEWMEEEIERRTDGRVQFEAFYAESLLSGVETLAGVQDGRANAGWVGATYQPADFPIWGMTLIYYQTNNWEAQMRAYWDLYQNDERFQREFEELGIKMLAFYSHGPNVIGTKEPIDSIHDLSGQRLRAGGLIDHVIAEVGADPVGMSVAEVYEALARGAIDGFTNFPFELVAPLGWYEVAPVLVHSGIGVYAGSGIAINLDDWNAMAPETQEIINGVSEDWLEAWSEILVSIEDAACETYIEEEVSIIVLPEGDSDDVRQTISNELIEEWKDQVETSTDLTRDEAQEMFDDYLSAIRSYEETTEYVDPFTRCLERM